MIKLSIVLPVYGVDNDYLSECIQSVLAQSYADFELICVNDNSPNRENLTLLNEFQKNDSRIKVINLTTNVGAAEARNIGLESVKGDFVAFMDCDDFLNLDYYEILMEEIEKNQADIAMCGFVKIDKYGKVGKKRLQKQSIATKDDTQAKQAQFESLSYSPCNKIYRFSVVKDIRFPKGVRLAEDVLYNFNAFLSAKTTVSTDRTFYNYRTNSNSVTSGEKNGVTEIKTNIVVLKELIKDFDKYLLPLELQNSIINYFYYRFIRYANKFRRVDSEELRQELWSDYVNFFNNEFVEVREYKRELFDKLSKTFSKKQFPKFLQIRVKYYNFLLKKGI